MQTKLQVLQLQKMGHFVRDCWSKAKHVCTNSEDDTLLMTTADDSHIEEITKQDFMTAQQQRWLALGMMTWFLV